MTGQWSGVRAQSGLPKGALCVSRPPLGSSSQSPHILSCSCPATRGAKGQLTIEATGDDVGSSPHVRTVDRREEGHKGRSDARAPGLMQIASMFDCIFNTVFSGKKKQKKKKLCLVVVLRISGCQGSLLPRNRVD